MARKLFKVQTMKTILLSNDLMLGSQVTQAARQVDADLEVIAQAGQLVAACDSAAPDQVILDLNNSLPAIAELIEQIRDVAPDARIIAIAPHVHVSKIETAQAAGCDAVLTKGQFHGQMTEVLAG